MKFFYCFAICAIATGPTLQIAPALSAQSPAGMKHCNQNFVATWRKDQEAALKRLPSKACLMKAPAGVYVCYHEGCVRDHVYFEEHQ